MDAVLTCWLKRKGGFKFICTQCEEWASVVYYHVNKECTSNCNIPRIGLCESCFINAFDIQETREEFGDLNVTITRINVTHRLKPVRNAKKAHQ